MRLLAQHNLSECQDMVDASANAIEEWVPIMTALRRQPGVSSRVVMRWIAWASFSVPLPAI
jgi:hypothetical protein